MLLDQLLATSRDGLANLDALLRRFTAWQVAVGVLALALAVLLYDYALMLHKRSKLVRCFRALDFPWLALYRRC